MVNAYSMEKMVDSKIYVVPVDTTVEVAIKKDDMTPISFLTPGVIQKELRNVSDFISPPSFHDDNNYFDDDTNDSPNSNDLSDTSDLNTREKIFELLKQIDNKKNTNPYTSNTHEYEEKVD